LIRALSCLCVAALVLGAAADPASAQRRGPPPLPSIGLGTANPSAIVAAELGLARLSREDGQWTAFRDMAEKDAVIFAPAPVNAPAWLKKQADPTEPMSWSPQQVFMSCDGSYGAATGPLRKADGTQGRFVTIWRQQRKGDYKWVMTFASGETPAAQDDDGAISASVATCRRGPPLSERERRKRRHFDVVRIPDPPPASGSGQSADGTLRWTWNAQGESRTIEVFLNRPDGEERVIHASAPMAGP